MAETLVAYGSRVEITYATEDSWAVLGSGYVPYKLRCNSFSINPTKDTFTDEELRSDRQTADLRHGIMHVGGDISCSFSYGSFDDLIESVMFNTWASDGTIQIGTSQKSLTIQRAFVDIGEYHVFNGCVVNTWKLDIKPNTIITCDFSFIGKEMSLSQVFTSASDKSLSSPFDSFTGEIKEGGNVIAIVTGIDFTIENNISPLTVVLDKSPIGLAEGRAHITGNVTAYFPDSTLLNKFINETESSLEVTITDLDGHSYTFLFPRIKYTGADIPVDGEGPVSQTLPFTALVDSTYSSLQITRV